MPEKVKDKVLSPTRGYDVKLMIKNLDYSNDLRSVRIVSAINTAYQIIQLTLSLDPNDIILADVMGKEPLKLLIKLLDRDVTKLPKEDIELELQYVTSDNKASPKSQMSEESSQGSNKERNPIEILTVCRKPFKTMTTMVNDIFMEKTPRKILEELISNAGAELKYDDDGENKEAIDQIIIPPNTLYKTIRYLDDNFGLFDGACNLGFCQYTNKVYIQNLTAKMNKSQAFTIYQLAGDSPNNKKIIDMCGNGKKFYTYGTLENKYTGSAILAAKAKIINHIVKPKDKLYRVIKQNYNDVCSKFGAIFKNSQMKNDSNLDERETYKINSSGNDSSDTYANAKTAREIIGLSTVKIALEKDLPILRLMRIGECVKLKCGTLEYVPLSGKYILKSSDLNFTRDAAYWNASCEIVIMRTNQYF